MKFEFAEFKKIDTYVEFSRLNCSGIYVIWNKTKNKYYVGQAKNIRKRIFLDHFGSKINKLFLIDKKVGDVFYFNYYKCAEKDLNQEELLTIRKFDSYNNGYNKTDGNLLTNTKK